MKTREFYLRIYKNGDEETQESKYVFLNNINDAGVITNPDGLGLNIVTDSIRVGNRNITSDVKADFEEISLTINFKGYNKYNDFINNLSYGNFKARLYYILNTKINDENSVGLFCRDVVIQSGSKTELKKGILSCEFTIKPLSFWYNEYKSTISLAENKDTSYTFKGVSHLPIEIKFVTASKGNVFKMMMLSNNDQKLLKLINLDKTQYPYINYSSEDGNFFIRSQGSQKELQQDIRTNEFIDLAVSTPFIQLPPNESGILIFNSDVKNTVYLTIKAFYVSV